MSMQKNNFRKKLIWSSILIAAILLILWTVWGNTALELNTITVSSENLPETFEGYRIAHVSDLHNAEMGDNNENLIEMLKTAEPDIIALTGDLIDSNNTNVDIALQFAREAVKIARCYYVTGNHEASVNISFEQLERGLIQLGVVVLRDEAVTLEYNGEIISLIGLDDPSFTSVDERIGGTTVMMDKKLKELTNETDSFTLLLSHRPELFDTYVKNDIDMVLSGHAHGGQFRLPFVGGLVAPNQGLLPEYDAGLYTVENTNMIVSRGIGNSIILFRFNNRPEVILIELER